MNDFFNKITSATDDNSSINKSKTNIDNAVNKMSKQSDKIMVGNNYNQHHSNIEGREEENQSVAENTTTKVDKKTNTEIMEDKKIKTPEKLILGLKPLNFGLALLGVAIASYFVYENFYKKGKTLAIIK